jgi:hypothetical protein
MSSLSVLVPGIRTANWKKLYDSIKSAWSNDFEIIFVGPYDLPQELTGFENVKYIKDCGNPIRCQQIALVNATGDYVTWAADDGVFLDGSLDIALSKLDGMDYKHIVMGKYREGSGNTDPMIKDFYYNLKNHAASQLKELPSPTIWMLNVGLVSRQLLIEVGGWDCQFEVCPMAYNDLAIRLQNYGCPFIIQDEIMFTCSHLPGHEGDHGPIHDGQVLHDQPLFDKIYSLPYAEKRIKISIDCWKESNPRWKRRFGRQ